MIGETLSHYQILELTARGGMGDVYRARDRRLRRTVALKLLRPERVGDPRRRRRFLREARACSLLNHPGIVSIYDVGCDRGLDFLVMEWVEGRTLETLIEDGGLPISRALAYARQIADALVAAHAAGVIHRDLKPRNVMIDTVGRVKVLDLGVAKVEPLADGETVTTDGSGLTEDGMVPGTVAYMAPEQALGEGVDRRSDIFSFGIVLYEMLTGRPPFQGVTLAALVRQLVFAEPPPVSELRPEVPPALATLVARALAKKPEERPADMVSLSAELRALESVAAAGGTAPLAPLARRRPSPGRRRSRRWVLSGLGLVLALTALGVLSEEPWPAVGERPAAASPLPRSPYELFTEGLERLARYDREGYIDAAIDRFDAAIRRSPDYAPAYSGLARAYWRQYRLRHDPVWLHRAEASARRALELDPHLTHARVSLARIQVSLGQRDVARKELERLRRLDPDNGEVLEGLGEIAFLDGDLQQSATLYQEAIRHRPRDWSLYSGLGIVEASLGDLDAAEAAFRKSTELVPDNAFARRNLAGVYSYQGRYAEAVTQLQASISIRPTAVAYSNLGTVYYFQGLYHEAASAFEDARRLGANSYQLWGNLADAYRQLPGREEDARAGYRRALQLLEQQKAEDPGDEELKSRKALFLAKLGDKTQSREVLTGIEPLGDQDAATIYRVAFARELCGERALALRALELALERGYPFDEVRDEPELTRLREDLGYHRLALRFAASPEGPEGTGGRDAS